MCVNVCILMHVNMYLQMSYMWMECMWYIFMFICHMLVIFWCLMNSFKSCSHLIWYLTDSIYMCIYFSENVHWSMVNEIGTERNQNCQSVGLKMEKFIPKCQRWFWGYCWVLYISLVLSLSPDHRVPQNNQGVQSVSKSREPLFKLGLGCSVCPMQWCKQKMGRQETTLA